jgi:hypothetical protein
MIANGSWDCAPQVRRSLDGDASTIFAWRAETEASPADGAWLIKDLVLDIFDCQRLVCGRIIWIGDAARRQAQCGKTIVCGLQAQGQSEWRVVRSSILMMTKHTG